MILDHTHLRSAYLRGLTEALSESRKINTKSVDHFLDSHLVSIVEKLKHGSLDDSDLSHVRLVQEGCLQSKRTLVVHPD